MGAHTKCQSETPRTHNPQPPTKPNHRGERNAHSTAKKEKHKKEERAGKRRTSDRVGKNNATPKEKRKKKRRLLSNVFRIVVKFDPGCLRDALAVRDRKLGGTLESLSILARRRPDGRRRWGHRRLGKPQCRGGAAVEPPGPRRPSCFSSRFHELHARAGTPRTCSRSRRRCLGRSGVHGRRGRGCGRRGHPCRAGRMVRWLVRLGACCCFGGRGRRAFCFFGVGLVVRAALGLSLGQKNGPP